MDIAISVTFPQFEKVLETMAVNKAEILARLDRVENAIVVERSEFLEVLQLLRDVKAQSEANADLTEIANRLDVIIDKTTGIVTKDEESTPPVTEPAPVPVEETPSPDPAPVPSPEPLPPVDEVPVEPTPAPVEEPPVVEPAPIPAEEPPAV
jgi:hypothetical protein